MSGADLFWLAPFLPLAVFAVLVVLPRCHGLAAVLAVSGIAGSAIVSALALIGSAQGIRAEFTLAQLVIGERKLTFAFALDPLGAVAAALVSIIGLIVFIYAVSYMAGDANSGRFFAELSLFIGAMLSLVLASDLVTLFIAWELVGLCSYLLIGFWFERPGVPAAATKAFLTTRLGDLAMLAGSLLLIGTVGHSRISDIFETVLSGKIEAGLLLTATLLLFTGAAGKSAQVPLHGWLPDAMVGPTPVSALLHSATMVAAGVFLVARLYPLFLAAPPTLQIVAWVGGITALMGAACALVQTDLKRTLAYSTMSQLGLMFLGLGAGSLLAGILLLVAQALYKSTLFLAAGAVDHEVEGTQFERMGGLVKRMPFTLVAFAIGAAALAGLPVTIALPPKDATLAAAWHSSAALFSVAFLASFLTALYSSRVLALVFLGTPSEPARRGHEARPGLLVPTLVLSGLVVFGLLADATILGRPLAHLLGTSTPETIVITVLTLAVAAVGVGLGLWACMSWPRAVIWPVLKGVASIFSSEFGFIPMCRAFTRGTLRLTAMVGVFDRRVFDPVSERVAAALRSLVGAVARFDGAIFDAFSDAVAQATLRMIKAANRFDLQRLDASVRGFGEKLLSLSQRVRSVQTGRVENYLLSIFVWGLIAFAMTALAIVF
jgi:NADH-quinone oxidoreductase subunit L